MSPATPRFWSTSAERRFWRIAIRASVPIHGAFCLQALMALPRGSLLHGWFGKSLWRFAIFFPQAMLMSFLPPKWPELSPEADWPRVVGKLAVAYPASLAYDMVLGAIWLFCARAKANGRSGR
jgi:hypothetical protein